MHSHSPTASHSPSAPGGLSGLHPGPRVSDHGPSRPAQRFPRRWLLLPLLVAIVSFAYAHHHESRQLRSWQDQRQSLLLREQLELGRLQREVRAQQNQLRSETRMIDHLTRRADFQQQELQQVRVEFDVRGRQLADLRTSVRMLEARLSELPQSGEGSR